MIENIDNRIKERLLEFYNDGIPDFIRRDIKIQFIKNMAITITGGRKSGKSFLTYQIISDLLNNKMIDVINQVCYLHFDDEGLMQLKDINLERIEKVFYSILPEEYLNKDHIFVFDEIHKIKGWEN